MQRDGVKVFLAVAFGVGIGILTGRALPMSYGWLIGAVCGGLVGYFAVAPLEALRAVPRAWTSAWGVVRLPRAWEAVRWATYVAWAVTTSVVVVIGAIIALFCVPDGGATSAYVASRVTETFLITAMCGCALQVILVGRMLGTVYDAVRAEHHTLLDREIEEARSLAVHALLPVILCYHLPRGLALVARRVPSAMWAFARLLGRFTRAWFRLVHSDLRLLCLADAFLFAGLGVLLGGPILMWMLIGGVIGVLNYEFVSVRFFGQHPVLFRRR